MSTARAGATPFTVTGNAVPPALPLPDAAKAIADCDLVYGDGAQEKARVLCHAYFDAVQALQVAGTPTFTDWVKSPTHLAYRTSDAYALFFTSDGQPIAPLPQVDENDKLVIVVVAKGLEQGLGAAPLVQDVHGHDVQRPGPRSASEAA